jgi:hypothetical protein
MRETQAYVTVSLLEQSYFEMCMFGSVYDFRIPPSGNATRGSERDGGWGSGSGKTLHHSVQIWYRRKDVRENEFET